jgi:hypothetical protein
MIFFFGVFLEIYIGRKLGWALTRRLLYSCNWPICIVSCLIWGIAVAYGLRLAILQTHPNWLLMAFGYGASAYVAVPNYGIGNGGFWENNINPYQRQQFLQQWPLVFFIIASIAFAFAGHGSKH